MSLTVVDRRGNDPLPFVYRAVFELARLWNDPKVNRSGLRSTFRRWRPSTDGTPTMDMRSSVWSWAGSPADKQSEEDKGEWNDREIQRTIDRAAVMVSLRAIAGEHEGVGTPFGAALYKAGLSDLRFSRFLTTTRDSKLESMRRALQLIDRSRISIAWEKETRHIYNYLFGNDESAQWSINAWASDFFAARGKSSDPDEKPAETEQSIPTEG